MCDIKSAQSPVTTDFLRLHEFSMPALSITTEFTQLIKALSSKGYTPSSSSVVFRFHNLLSYQGLFNESICLT